ncbi:hypothetical protein Clacol_007752 [Clathrus columnatus]|uniref:Uncharacterized protein n=1 Tax=Clathrus columnatus TaxID=1419009 RepID=A0AAV5ALC8_9AGAM|nr:hypothetical protein Clacol_007752 [Clathrus columnatus]
MALPPIRTVLYDIFSKPDIVHERPSIADKAEARYCSNSLDEPRRHSEDHHLNGRLSPVSLRLSLSPPPAAHDDQVLLSQDYSQNSQPSSACYLGEYPQQLERRELDSIFENTLTPFRSASSSDPLIHLHQDRLELLLRSSMPSDQISNSSMVNVETTARRRPRQYKKLPRPHQTGCECYIPGGGFPTWKAMLKHVIRSSEQGRLTLSEIRLELRKRFPCVSDTLPRHDVRPKYPSYLKNNKLILENLLCLWRTLYVKL